MKKIIFETERLYIEEREISFEFTVYNIGVKEFSRYIVEGDYFNLETAIEDINYLENTIKDIKTLFKINPIYD